MMRTTLIRMPSCHHGVGSVGLLLGLTIVLTIRLSPGPLGEGAATVWCPPASQGLPHVQAMEEL